MIPIFAETNNHQALLLEETNYPDLTKVNNNDATEETIPEFQEPMD